MEYLDAATSRTGTMVCGACGKPIETGEYRVREKSDRYITHHRACTASDPAWQQRDREKKAREEHDSAFVRACVEFKAEWGVSELDGYIEATDGQ